MLGVAATTLPPSAPARMATSDFAPPRVKRRIFVIVDDALPTHDLLVNRPAEELLLAAEQLHKRRPAGKPDPIFPKRAKQYHSTGLRAILREGAIKLIKTGRPKAW